MRDESIYVVAQNGGCEGHSLPYLAFLKKEDALAWCRAQSAMTMFSVAEVPIYPAIPKTDWVNVEAIKE